ncbi:hypothetical protein FRC05_001604 [Tulasnella sp. 425]|nr:hypothetical protein FRC05_001604 [Tulasnella sp. 425]
MRRFQREAEMWERLRHPHILACLGTFHRDGNFYFVSPFIENGTLVEYIAMHPSVNRIRLLCETADVISYLHKEDIVHGDIKASSLLFGDNGQVLLSASASGLTLPADVRNSPDVPVEGPGTLRWQSPELLEGGSKSFKSDVYAFGMTIAEVLTGDVPFPDLRTDEAIISAIRIEGKRPPKDPPVSSAGLSYGKVWAVAEACWRTIPEKRISMSDALQMIQEDPALTVTQADPALPAIQDITSSSLVDVGSFIISISNDAVRLNGHFCDVFEGIHSTAGRVALKRPRIAGTGEEDATMRVGVPDPITHEKTVI